MHNRQKILMLCNTHTHTSKKKTKKKRSVSVRMNRRHKLLFVIVIIASPFISMFAMERYQLLVSWSTCIKYYRVIATAAERIHHADCTQRDQRGRNHHNYTPCHRYTLRARLCMSQCVCVCGMLSKLSCVCKKKQL
jgi:hypothetical protein